MTDPDYVLLSRDALFEFFGEMALPPWTDSDNSQIGGSINCAVIAERLTSWVDEHDMSGAAPGGTAVTDPEQVAVNVASLQAIKDWWYGTIYEEDEPLPMDLEARHAFYRVFDCIPEPEWEPTNEQVAQYKRAQDVDHAQAISHLKAMHREGLL